MKKNGFIATSLLYSFLTVFVVLITAILASYSFYQNAIDTLNDGIEEALESYNDKKYVSLRNSITNGSFEDNTNKSVWYTKNMQVTYKNDTGYIDGIYNVKSPSSSDTVSGTNYILGQYNFNCVDENHDGNTLLYVRFNIQRDSCLNDSNAVYYLRTDNVTNSTSFTDGGSGTCYKKYVDDDGTSYSKYIESSIYSVSGLSTSTSCNLSINYDGKTSRVIDYMDNFMVVDVTNLYSAIKKYYNLDDSFDLEKFKKLLDGNDFLLDTDGNTIASKLADLKINFFEDTSLYDVSNGYKSDLNKITGSDYTPHTFSYTGGEQTLKIEVTGNYKLQVWGAQGGTIDSTYVGGYGGYSEGVAFLQKGEYLYINVGGKGTACRYSYCSANGGYNGGGGAHGYSSCTYDSYWGSGGGATHIATTSGLLSSLSSSTDKILIVAGGGGGANLCNTCCNYASGGSGGGYKGVGSVNIGAPHFSANGGNDATGGTQDSGYSFGLGGGSTSSSSSVGAGGGYYGGKNSGINGAGGGSGYIGNTRLDEKTMYCYKCEASSDYSTKTVSTTSVSEEPTINYAKIGDGYAKITFIG